MGYGASNLTGECFSQAATDLGGGSPSPRHEGLWGSASKKVCPVHAPTLGPSESQLLGNPGIWIV